jgi:hypothetical protein
LVFLNGSASFLICAPRINYNSSMRAAVFILLLALCPVANARIGETESECNTRYGTPKKVDEIVPGCPTNEYDYHGFKIRIAFPGFSNPAIKMVFTKYPSPFFKDDEIAAILNANTKGGTAWKGVASESELAKKSDPLTRMTTAMVTSSVGARSWVRSDGVTAELEIPKTGLTITTPEAVAREKRAKDEAEAKRKAAIPNF